MQENTKNQGLLNNEIEEMNQKLSKATGMESIKNSINEASNSMTGLLKKVAQWTLAVFGIRSAYNAVRSAMSTLTQYDDQMATNVEYIRYLLASTLKPIIEYLINLAYKLLTYINYISQAWFGINLFANATTEAFQKQNKVMSGTVKQAKELQKTLAGFDEMNILQENGDVVSGGGGGGIGSSILPNFENIEIPKWVQWIAENKDKILDWVKLLAVLFGAIKIGQFLASLGQAGEGLSKFGKKITDNIREMGLWKTVGTVLMIAGIVLLIKNVYDLITKWDELDGKQKAMKIALAVLGTAFITLGYMMKKGFDIGTAGVGILISVITTLVSAIGGLIVKLFQEEKAILSTKDAAKKLKEAKDDLRDATDSYIDAVDREKEANERLIEIQNQTGLSGEELYKQVENGTLDYKNMTDAQKDVYKAYYELKKAQEDVTTSSKNLKTAKQNEKDATWDDALAKRNAKDDINGYKDAVIKAWQEGKISTKDAQTYISKAMTEMDDKTKLTFAKNIPDEIKKGLDVSKYQTTMQKLENYLKQAWNNIWWTLKSTAKGFASGITSALGFSSGGVNFSTGGVTGFAKGGVTGFARGGVIKMASGSIINQPGRGVPMSRAIGGEAGHEGIIPLTNTQMMNQLGESIAKHINLNATIPIYMGNRQIAREIKQIELQNDFAFNR